MSSRAHCPGHWLDPPPQPSWVPGAEPTRPEAGAQPHGPPWPPRLPPVHPEHMPCLVSSPVTGPSPVPGLHSPSCGPLPRLHFSGWPRAGAQGPHGQRCRPLQAHEGAGVRRPSATAPPASRWQDSWPRPRNTAEGWAPTGATLCLEAPRLAAGMALGGPGHGEVFDHSRPRAARRGPRLHEVQEWQLCPPCRRPGLQLPKAGGQGHWVTWPGVPSGLTDALPALAGDCYRGENSAGRSLKISTIACS